MNDIVIGDGRLARIPLYDKSGDACAYAVIDADAEATIGQYRWFPSHGYAVRRETGKKRTEARRTIYMHREILGIHHGGRNPCVDHANGDRLDNRKCNIRVCSPRENRLNARKPRGRSGLKGTTFNKPMGRWSATISDRVGHRIVLGWFTTATEAAIAYDAAAIEHYGPFAATNKSLGLYA